MVISPRSAHPFWIPMCDLKHKVAVWQNYDLNGVVSADLRDCWPCSLSLSARISGGILQEGIRS